MGLGYISLACRPRLTDVTVSTRATRCARDVPFVKLRSVWTYPAFSNLCYLTVIGRNSAYKTFCLVHFAIIFHMNVNVSRTCMFQIFMRSVWIHDTLQFPTSRYVRVVNRQVRDIYSMLKSGATPSCCVDRGTAVERTGVKSRWRRKKADTPILAWSQNRTPSPKLLLPPTNCAFELTN